MGSNAFLIRILSVVLVTVLFAGSSFAQGKGRGGGKGDRGGDRGGSQKHGGGDRGGNRGDRGDRGGNRNQGAVDRGGNRGDRGDRGDRSRGSAERRGGGNPWGGGDRGQRRQEQRQVQNVQRQQGQQWQNAQRQQSQQWRNAQRQQGQQWQNAQRQQRDEGRRHQRNQRDEGRQQRQQNNRWQNAQRQGQRAYSQPQQNWGQFRRQQNFDRKQYRNEAKVERRSQRDAWKYARKQQQFDEKAFRRSNRAYQRNVRPYAYGQRDAWANADIFQPRYRDDRSYDSARRNYQVYQPVYPQYYQQYYQPGYRTYDYSQVYTPYSGYAYDDDGYGGNQGGSWVEPLLRSVLASFFSGGGDGGYYNDYDNGQPYYADNYGYAPQYGYGQPTHYTFGYAPTSAYYEPAAYYGYDQYAGNDLPYDAFQGVLPYNDVVDIYSGGIAGDLIQRALGTGYYQGLLEGQLARERGWGDRYYSDPYLYEQAIYDPYSTSIGDNRRYFSEGYERGYEDALGGNDEFALAEGGDVDLMSLLLGNVLSFRG